MISYLLAQFGNQVESISPLTNKRASVRGKRGQESHWSCGSLCYCGTKHGKMKVKTQHQANTISGLQLQSCKDHLFTSSSLRFQARVACCCHLSGATWSGQKFILSKAHIQNNHLSSWPRDPTHCGCRKRNNGLLKSLKGSFFQSKDDARWKMHTHCTSRRYQTWLCQSQIFWKHLELHFSTIPQ